MPPSLLDSRPESHGGVLLWVRAAEKLDEQLDRVEVSLPCGAQDRREDCLGSRPSSGPIAASRHLSVHHGWPDGLLAVEVHGCQLGVVQEGKDLLPVVDDVPGQLSVLVVRELLRDQLVEAPLELACPIAELSPAETPLVTLIAQEQGVLQQSLELTREAHAASVVALLKAAAAHDQVPQTELVGRELEPIVGRPAVPSEKARVIDPGLFTDRVKRAEQNPCFERSIDRKEAIRRRNRGSRNE
jgi:hypothetical protein